MTESGPVLGPLVGSRLCVSPTHSTARVDFDGTVPVGQNPYCVLVSNKVVRLVGLTVQP